MDALEFYWIVKQHTPADAIKWAVFCFLFAGSFYYFLDKIPIISHIFFYICVLFGLLFLALIPLRTHIWRRRYRTSYPYRNLAFAIFDEQGVHAEIDGKPFHKAWDEFTGYAAGFDYVYLLDKDRFFLIIPRHKFRDSDEWRAFWILLLKKLELKKFP
ncbi:MAG: hypothetical protein OEZ39_17745 [Gammaproteobacteria bacterium]|nr:hypothetical protein [Gammaproteobacteria bacterium]MDH5653709.1 hypothetical protein [Gammaproteobacteria bacterium]